MPKDQPPLHELLVRQLRELKLTQIAETYREVLDEAARKNTSMLEVLAALISAEVTHRQQHALQRRIRQAKSPRGRLWRVMTSRSLGRSPNRESFACSTVNSWRSISAPC